MLDLIHVISDPILKDGVAVIAIIVLGLFTFVKHMLKVLTSISSNKKKEPAETRLEKYFREEISKRDSIHKQLQDEHKRLQIDNTETKHTIIKLYLQIKVQKSRIKYLEIKLIENKIKFAPTMENFDD